jgi:hypothetical protein
VSEARLSSVVQPRAVSAPRISARASRAGEPQPLVREPYAPRLSAQEVFCRSTTDASGGPRRSVGGVAAPRASRTSEPTRTVEWPPRASTLSLSPPRASTARLSQPSQYQPRALPDRQRPGSVPQPLKPLPPLKPLASPPAPRVSFLQQSNPLLAPAEPLPAPMLLAEAPRAAARTTSADAMDALPSHSVTVEHTPVPSTAPAVAEPPFWAPAAVVVAPSPPLEPLAAADTGAAQWPAAQSDECATPQRPPFFVSRNTATVAACRTPIFDVK